jgi:hypothetical protein
MIIIYNWSMEGPFGTFAFPRLFLFVSMMCGRTGGEHYQGSKGQDNARLQSYIKAIPI